MKFRSILRKFSAGLMVTFLAAGMLSACGKKETVTEEQYVYTASYERLENNPEENMYSISSEIAGDYIFSVLCEYNWSEGSDESSRKYFIKKKDLNSKEETLVRLSDDMLGDNAYIQYSHVFDDGKIGAIVTYYDETTMDNAYYYKIYSESGEVESENPIIIGKSGDFSYISKVVFRDDRSIIVQSNESINLFDNSGKQIKSLSVQNWINDMVVTSEGRIYILTYIDGYGEALCPVKSDFSGLDEKIEIPLNNAGIYSSKGNSIFISTSISLKEYDLTSQTTTKVWDWFDLDFDGNRIISIEKTGDSTYRIVSEVWGEDFSGTEIATIKKEKAEPGTEKATLVYGCTYVDNNVMKAIKKFNKNNSKYRVTVKSYVDEMEDGNHDWNLIEEKMGADLTRGEIDIVDLSNGLNYRKLASSKALAKLDDYFAKDINEADYFNNVFEASKVNGKQYCVIPTASIATLAFSHDVTKGKESITLDDMLEIRKAYPDIEFASYANKTQMLFTCLAYSLNEFVDYDKATCSFDSENFIKIMEFSNTFRKEADYDEDYDDWGAMQKGDVIMANLYLSDTDELQLYSQLMKGGLDITGYPVSSGSGNVIMAGQQFAIAEKSKHKDGAWEFLKSFLEEDFQNSERYGALPLLRSAFDARMEEAVKESTWTDEFGEVHVESHGSWGNGHTTIELFAPSQAEVDLIKRIYESSTYLGEYDEQLFAMIEEEMGSYYAGQKSAQEVASTIQGRIKIYLAESK